MDRAEKTCARWSPYKNADDGNRPSLCAATRKADVSTKFGQSSLHWSRHTAGTATTSCPQYCFMVMPHRHPPFVIDLFSASTDLQRFFWNKGIHCAKLDPFSGDITKLSTRMQEILCILASCRTLAVMISPPVSSLSVARNHRLAKCDTTLGTASFLKCPTDVRSPKTICVSPLVSEWPEHASV